MWERVQTVLLEALARLGAALAADLPGFVAMLLVVVAALVAAFVVRVVLRRGARAARVRPARARVGAHQRSRRRAAPRAVLALRARRLLVRAARPGSRSPSTCSGPAPPPRWATRCWPSSRGS